MIEWFADTAYFVALLNPNDDDHAQASALTDGFDGCMVTTAWVLTEVAASMAHHSRRGAFVTLARAICDDPRSVLVPADMTLFQRGLELYAERPDKDWSLTDCISFLVMQDRNIDDALTTDHHFAQAGFGVLMR